MLCNTNLEKLVSNPKMETILNLSLKIIKRINKLNNKK
jgi:hypothetical protein